MTDCTEELLLCYFLSLTFVLFKWNDKDFLVSCLDNKIFAAPEKCWIKLYVS